MVEHLPQVIPPEPGRPERGGVDHPMRVITRRVALHREWTRDMAAEVVRLFDDLAPEWHTRTSPHRFQPLEDALERGGRIPRDRCLEVGSGTGLLSPWLAERFGSVVAADLSMEMLRLAPAHPPRMRCDSSRLPLPPGSFGCVLLFNMLLFPDEVARVLQHDGALIWVNSSGDATPIHLSADELETALGDGWSVVASEAGWGTWAVARRR